LIGKKSKFLFQVHDSFVFDIHPDEMSIVDEIKKILSKFNNIDLQVNASEGNNLYECSMPEEIMDMTI
jgi:DNA polymerase I-like protein with 3'-5' exonuclease and polymerase domains